MPIKPKATPFPEWEELVRQQNLQVAEHVQRAREARQREAERQAERERLRAMPPEYVLTLVHGTRLPFTQKATWVSPRSLLATELTERLGWRVAIESIDWGGGNSPKARAKGATILREHLRAIRAEAKYEGARHVVIAHSHGGNVAVSAMDSSDEARGVLGVVTLGTPFLSATRRQIDMPLNLGSGLFAALSAGFSVVVIGAAYGQGWTWWTWGGLAAMVVAVALMLGAWVAERMKRHAGNIFRSMPRTHLSADQLLIIRTEGDEAAAVLSGARVAGACIDLVWRDLSEPVLDGIGGLLKKWDYLGLDAFQRRFYSDIEKKDWGLPEPETEPVTVTGTITKYVLPMTGPLIGALLGGPQDPQTDPLAYWVLSAVALLYGLPALLALVVTVVSMPFVAVFAIGLLPSGWTLPLAGPFLDVTAEPAPPGKWWVTQIDPSHGQGLSHSKSYDDSRVFDAIAEWVKSRHVPNESAACGT